MYRCKSGCMIESYHVHENENGYVTRCPDCGAWVEPEEQFECYKCHDYFTDDEMIDGLCLKCHGKLMKGFQRGVFDLLEGYSEAEQYAIKNYYDGESIF